MALPFAKQSIERAKGRLKAGVKTGQPRQKEAPQTRVERAPSNKVFIVHGHDHALLNEVARFVEELGLEPVILKEKPHGGKTLIEKFETYADVSYAVILLTPDDLGRPATPDTAPLRPRARQNAVLEWGFFMGKRGRDRVAVLYKGGVERPTDIEGIAYIPADDAGWKYDLVRELEHAGFTLRTPRA